jgi:RNA polymerase sigma-70 factor (ECF subfamily)
LEQVDKEFTPSLAVAHINSIAVDQNLELEKVWTAVQKLEPEHQDVIVMRFIDELSIRETAKAMEKSEGAIKVLQHRAIQKLKTILSEKV